MRAGACPGFTRPQPFRGYLGPSGPIEPRVSIPGRAPGAPEAANDPCRPRSEFRCAVDAGDGARAPRRGDFRARVGLDRLRALALLGFRFRGRRVLRRRRLSLDPRRSPLCRHLRRQAARIPRVARLRARNPGTRAGGGASGVDPVRRDRRHGAVLSGTALGLDGVRRARRDALSRPRRVPAAGMRLFRARRLRDPRRAGGARADGGDEARVAGGAGARRRDEHQANRRPRRGRLAGRLAVDARDGRAPSSNSRWFSPPARRRSRSQFSSITSRSAWRGH